MQLLPALDAPGRSDPHKTVEAQSFLLAWGDGEEERSLVVIEPGDGLRRPAIIATLDNTTGAVRVAYAGTAYKDKKGNIHIDGRRARIYGPDRNRWSPDSFSIAKDGKVRWMDDAMRNGTGRALAWSAKDAQLQVFPEAFRKLDFQHNYKVMRLMAHVYLEGTL